MRAESRIACLPSLSASGCYTPSYPLPRWGMRLITTTPQAFPTGANQWLAEHGDTLYRYALARLRDPMLAEDAVQECLIAALTAHKRFRGNSTERTWLIGILKYKILDQFRRSSREVPIDDERDIDALLEKNFDSAGRWRARPRAWQDPGNALEREAFWVMLEHCIDELPGTLAATVRMIEIDEIGTDEACKALGISSTNLWVRMHRARLRLRECIERCWFDSTSMRRHTK